LRIEETRKAWEKQEKFEFPQNAFDQIYDSDRIKWCPMVQWYLATAFQSIKHTATIPRGVSLVCMDGRRRG